VFEVKRLTATLKGSLYIGLLAASCATALAQDTTFYSVSYIEVKPSSRTQAVALLKGYRESMRRDDSIIKLELFEQAERAGHFVIVETWRTSAAFDNRISSTRCARAAGTRGRTKRCRWPQALRKPRTSRST
jgi:quinol monooxygenase YgiN